MKMFFALILLATTLTSFAETGILFIAHGSMKDHGHGRHRIMECATNHHSEWEHYVHSTLQAVKKDIPHKFELAFGMWETKCFDQGIERLEASLKSEGKTLDHVIVFPMFISSHSEVIEMQKYIFKKRSSKVIPLPSVKQTKFTGRISYMKAFDYMPEISKILEKRFQALAKRAGEKGFTQDQLELILVMHGPFSSKANARWMEMGEAYVKDINAAFPVSATHVVSLRDDGLPNVKWLATRKLRSHIKKASAQGKVALILPLLISKGGIEAGIIKRMKGLDYIWTGETLLPDSEFKHVLLQKMKAELP